MKAPWNYEAIHMHLHDHYSFNFPKGYNIYYGIHFQALSTVTYFLSSVVPDDN